MKVSPYVRAFILGHQLVLLSSNIFPCQLLFAGTFHGYKSYTWPRVFKIFSFHTFIHRKYLFKYYIRNRFCSIFAVKSTNKFPLAHMGVLTPRSAQIQPSAQPPIDTSGNFSPHVSAESPSNISPNP